MENPSIQFGLAYGNEIKSCRVVMQDTSYDVYFNNEWIASIMHDDNWDWRLASGTILPESIIDAIGLKIESNYN